MSLGQKLEKTNFLETSWLKTSYLAEQSAFPRKEGTGQVWGSLEKMEAGEILKEPFKAYWDGRC